MKKTNQKQQMLIEVHFNHLERYLKWISISFTGLDSVKLTDFRYLLTRLRRIGKTRGGAFLINYQKDLRQALLIYLAGEYPTKYIKGVGVTSSGLPRALGPLKKIIRSKDSHTVRMTLRVLLTILYSTRSLRLGRTVDTTTITAPSKDGVPMGTTPYCDRYRRNFWTTLRYSQLTTIPKRLLFTEYHFTSKSGPNGHALTCAMADLWVLKRDYPELITKICSIAGDKLKDNINKLLPTMEFFISNMGLNVLDNVRKIVHFPDKELKTRVVAVADYFSQTALRPLHKYTFQILRKIPQDRTFSQGDFKKDALAWEEFYSIDLTAFTDRFPLRLQAYLLKGIFPEWYVDAWQYVMASIPFVYKKGKSAVRLTYNSGQPMGMYSSWNVCTLAHHYVMYCACMDLKIPWRTAKYHILGDDVLIGHGPLAMRYKEYISSLGVDFAREKTHESKTLFEFAKRLFYHGNEITPFPISALKESRKRYYLLVNLLNEEMARGWDVLDGIPNAISSFYSIFHRNSTFCAVIKEKSSRCEIIMKIMARKTSAKDGINSLYRLSSYGASVTFTEEQALLALRYSVIDAFVTSLHNFEDASRKGQPLGQSFSGMDFMIMMEDDDVVDRLRSAMHVVPVKYFVLKLKNDYHDLVSGASELIIHKEEEWPLLLKAVALPMDDRVFIERQSHTISRTSAIFADKVDDLLKTISNDTLVLPPLEGLFETYQKEIVINLSPTLLES